MNHYPDGHNLGPGMVYDTPEEKEIARLERELAKYKDLINQRDETIEFVTADNQRLRDASKQSHGPSNAPPSFKKLADVHRGWCNYCKGNVAWCRSAPEGGCKLRDCEREIDPSLFATSPSHSEEK